MFADLFALKSGAPNCFEAPPAPDKGERMFGGQFLAQSLYAAQVSAGNDRVANSLHAYFLRPGDVELPVNLTVEAVRDGRSFSSRQVVAQQGGKERFRMLASFQVADLAPEYTRLEMPEVPAPEACHFTYDDFMLQETGDADWPGSERPMDILYINAPKPGRDRITESQLMWMKVRGPVSDEPALQQAGLVYLSDASIVDHILLPHGMRWQDEGFEGTSLDHTMWFHRPARADEWLLFVQTVEATAGGRGLCRGHFFDQAGNLAATCIQEGLMRWSSPDAARTT